MSDELPPIDPGPTDPAPAPRVGASRTVKVVLFLSLAMNLLVVGVVAGAILAHSRPGGEPSLRDAGLGPLALVLDRQQRGALRDELRGQRDALRKNRVEMRQEIGRLTAALRAEPFDPAAFAAVLKDQARVVQARQEIGFTALVDAVTAASPAERRDMANRIERALRRAEGPSRH